MTMVLSTGCEQILKYKDIKDRWTNTVRQKFFKSQFLTLERQENWMDEGNETYHIYNMLTNRTTKFLCQQVYPSSSNRHPV